MKAETKKRLLGYIRVSTREQAIEGVSLAAQRAKILAYAEYMKDTVELVDIIEDAGVTASTLDRPGLRQALQCLRLKGEFGADGLIVTKLDRLSRDVAQAGQMLQNELKGKELVSLAEQFDTTSPHGRLMLHMLLSVAQWELEVIRQRTADALAHVKATEPGVKLGGEAYGWRRGERPSEDERCAIEPVAEELAVVERVRALHLEGFGVRQIAAMLEQEGHRTKKGHTRWQRNQVHRILTRSRVGAQ